MIANILKKLFGGIDLTWPKLLIASVLAGVYTAAVCIIPALQDTSFHNIAVTFEVWILFGILIIMNSKSNLDAALKCFVFFLISQPLVYLLQVPFSWQGWGLFGYYKYWFLWTLLCFPMGYVGYYMKRGKWWGYLILLPMLGFTAYAYLAYFSDFLFSRPRYVLISLFCALWLILYPVAIFADKRIKTVGAAVGGVLVAALTVLCLLNPPVYSTEILGSSQEHPFDDTYQVSLADEDCGEVRIVYLDSLEDYFLHADFRHAGDTVLTLEAPNGEQTVYDLHIERETYTLTQRKR